MACARFAGRRTRFGRVVGVQGACQAPLQAGAEHRTGVITPTLTGSLRGHAMTHRMEIPSSAALLAGEEASFAGWTIYTVGQGQAEATADALRLSLVDVTADALADAQVDDYHGRERAAFRWRPPLRLTVRARWSRPASALRGTTGFGFWNDPLDGKRRFVAAPSYVWFFHSSRPSRVGREDDATDSGLVAETMRGMRVPRVAIVAGNLALRLPGVERLATRFGARRAAPSEVTMPVDLDLTTWHDFGIDWRRDGVTFLVDGAPVASMPSDRTPRGPLGFVAWIDNQWLEVETGGRDRFGRLDAPGHQSLELGRVTIEATS